MMDAPEYIGVYLLFSDDVRKDGEVRRLIEQLQSRGVGCFFIKRGEEISNLEKIKERFLFGECTPKKKRKKRTNEVSQLLSWAIAPRPTTPRSSSSSSAVVNTTAASAVKKRKKEFSEGVDQIIRMLEEEEDENPLCINTFESEVMPPPPPPPMQLRRPPSCFYSMISGNVRDNLDNFLDGRLMINDKKKRRNNKKRRNGHFLLHHGDNFPEDPEAPYKLHLTTQIILKLNRRRGKFKPKEDKTKNLLSYLNLKLIPTTRTRGANNAHKTATYSSVFSGEWVQQKNYICNVCGHVETSFWDMVHHKGEQHPGVVVTHVELPEPAPLGFRVPPITIINPTNHSPPPCTKCGLTASSYNELYRHVFVCAGNEAWLVEGGSGGEKKKRRMRKRRGWKKRRVRQTNPNRPTPTTPTTHDVFKCEFCTREFKAEGWLRNHFTTSHQLKISIPTNLLEKVPMSAPPRVLPPNTAGRRRN